jgi:CheY-like chemotaxis protein
MARILVIEDQKLLCQLYGSALASTRHQVVLTYTGEEAVEEAARQKPDLVIMDLKLPGISGQEVARQLAMKGVFPGTPLIIATAFGEDARPVADSLRAQALIAKPFHLKVMLAEVEKALGGQPQPALAA